MSLQAPPQDPNVERVERRRKAPAAVALAAYRLVRAQQLYDDGNAAVEQQVGPLLEAVRTYVSLFSSPDVRLLFAGDVVFVNRRLLRAPKELYAHVLELGALLERAQANELCLTTDAARGAVLQVLRALLDAQRDASARERLRSLSVPGCSVRTAPHAQHAGRRQRRVGHGPPAQGLRGLDPHRAALLPRARARRGQRGARGAARRAQARGPGGRPARAARGDRDRPLHGRRPGSARRQHGRDRARDDPPAHPRSGRARHARVGRAVGARRGAAARPRRDGRAPLGERARRAVGAGPLPRGLAQADDARRRGARPAETQGLGELARHLAHGRGGCRSCARPSTAPEGARSARPTRRSRPRRRTTRTTPPLRLLVGALGFYPPQTVVQLSTGEVAVVTRRAGVGARLREAACAHRERRLSVDAEPPARRRSRQALTGRRASRRGEAPVAVTLRSVRSARLASVLEAAAADETRARSTWGARGRGRW
jgi:hypothetical protein